MRRLQWRFSLSGLPSSRPRFPIPLSSKWPPRNLVPAGIRHLSDRILRKASFILRREHPCFGCDNLSAPERAELHRLTSDSSLTVRSADKGGGWVLLETSDYLAEGRRQLGDPKYYAPVTRSSILPVKQRICRLLDSLLSSRFISRREHRALLPPGDPRPGSLSLLPKLHKPTWPTPAMPPGRPIVSSRQGVSRDCSNLLEFFSAPLARSLRSHVRDSLHLIALIKDRCLTKNSVLFTFDVASLYTNVPTEDGLRAVSEAFSQNPDPRRPDLTLLTLLRLFLSSNEFLFDGEVWVQRHGVSMGSIFGASYANIFLGSWEDRAFSRSRLLPTVFLRYQDDIFGIWDHPLDQLFVFQSVLNSVHDSIQVTLTHSLVSIRFLDLELYRLEGSDTLFYRTGFKPTDTHLLLSPDSHHPPHVFKAVLYSQVLRFATRSSTREDFNQAFNRATPRWRMQGYSRSAIREAKRRTLANLNLTTSWNPGFHLCRHPNCVVCQHSCPTTTFSDSSQRSLFLIVQLIDCSSTNVIYLLSCSNCSIRYVGETGRSLRHRFQQHLENIRYGRPTSVAEHFAGSPPSTCNITHLRVCGIDLHPDTRKRRVRESKWISRLQTTAPLGLNVVSRAPDPAINLAVPYSRCADRVVGMCRRACESLIRIRPAYLRGTNLGTLFKR